MYVKLTFSSENPPDDADNDKKKSETITHSYSYSSSAMTQSESWSKVGPTSENALYIYQSCCDMLA